MEEIGKQQSEISSEEKQICNEEMTPSALKMEGGKGRIERTASLNGGSNGFGWHPQGFRKTLLS